MVSVALISIVCAEAALCALACWLVWGISIAGFPLGILAVAAFILALLVRVAIVFLEFASARYWGSRTEPDARLGAVGAVRMVFYEIGAVFLVLGVLLPFTKRLIARRRGPVSLRSHLPVIFIHGYMSRRGIFAPMLRYLRSRGLTNMFTMHFHPRHGEMDDFAKQLAACVERVCNTTRNDRVILVGFSMGGLVARAYVERWGGAPKAAKVITIGTPHHGTGIARVFIGANGREMRVGSEWLRELNRDENIPEGPAYVAIYSAHDNMVYPQTSAELGKAKNIRLQGMGHFTLILSRETGNLVCREVMSR